MGLSAVSELPEVSTINDQDLLMVSHTDDGVNYTSNKLTYEDLESDMYIKLLEKIIEKLKSSYSSVLPLVWSSNIVIKDAKTSFGGTDVIAFYDVTET